MIEDETEHLNWYLLCKTFYETSDPVGKAVIEHFEGNAPDQGSFRINIIRDENLEKCLRDCNVFEIIDSDYWYKLNDIKNRARSDAHVVLLQRRLMHFENDTISLSSKFYQSDIPHSVIASHLRKLLWHLKNDPSLINFFRSFSHWISEQLINNNSLRWKIDGSTFTERSEHFQHDVKHCLCSIAHFHGRDEMSFIWELKPNLSNLYLRRFLRCFPDPPRPPPPLIGEIHAGSSTRGNVRAEHEDYRSYVINQLQCPIL